jgi:hypothetical protein
MKMNIENGKKIIERTSLMACSKAGANAEQLGAIFTLRGTGEKGDERRLYRR